MIFDTRLTTSLNKKSITRFLSPENIIRYNFELLTGITKKICINYINVISKAVRFYVNVYNIYL